MPPDKYRVFYRWGYRGVTQTAGFMHISDAVRYLKSMDSRWGKGQTGLGSIFFNFIAIWKVNPPTC